MTKTRVLIVTAHPQKESLCQHLSALAAVTASSHEVQLAQRDLYEGNFDPSLRVRERESYYTDRFDGTQVEEDIALLQNAEVLVLVFPTWWFGFPAILKGWFDRVWAPGVAFDHANDLTAIQPRLANLKHVIAITTLGSPWWVDWLLLRRPVKRVLKSALIGVCAPKAKLTFLSQYGAEKLSEPQIQKFEARIKSAIGRVLG